MARVKGYTNQQHLDYQKKVLTERCELLMFKKGINKSTIAAYLGITPQAVCAQFNSYSLSTSVIMAVVTLTDSADKIADALKIS